MKQTRLLKNLAITPNVMPEVIAPAPIDEQYLTVKYERMVPLLIEAIKELKQQVDDIKNQLNNQ